MVPVWNVPGNFEFGPHTLLKQALGLPGKWIFNLQWFHFPKHLPGATLAQDWIRNSNQNSLVPSVDKKLYSLYP